MTWPKGNRGSPNRNRIVTAALFAPFVLMIAVIAYTRDSARGRRDMEARLLRIGRQQRNTETE